MSDILMTIIGIVLIGILGIVCLFLCAISTIIDIIRRMEDEDD